MVFSLWLPKQAWFPLQCSIGILTTCTERTPLTDAISTPPLRNYRFARAILLVALVGVGFGFSVLFAILGPLGREVGLSELQISSIIAASSLTVFLASPRWGRLSDRWGRKPLMIFGLLGYACGNFLFASVFHAALIGALLPLSAYLLLMLTRVLHASLMSAIMPASSAYMADITDLATRTKGCLLYTSDAADDP